MRLLPLPHRSGIVGLPQPLWSSPPPRKLIVIWIRSCFGLAASLLILGTMPSAALEAQVMEDSVLAGIDTVDARIYITWDDRLTAREEETKSRLQTVFELELRKARLPVSRNAPNFLTMEIVLLRSTTGVVAFSYNYRLYEYGLSNRQIRSILTEAVVNAYSPDAARDTSGMSFRSAAWLAALYDFYGAKPWVITWEGSAGVVTTGEADLRNALEDAVTNAAQSFANAWLSMR